MKLKNIHCHPISASADKLKSLAIKPLHKGDRREPATLEHAERRGMPLCFLLFKWGSHAKLFLSFRVLDPEGTTHRAIHVSLGKHPGSPIK